MTKAANTHRVDLWDTDGKKWTAVSDAPSQAIAEQRAEKTGCTARVVEIATGHTVAGWKQGKRVALK